MTEIWLHGQAVKTSPFHGGNTGSIPVGVIYGPIAQLVRAPPCHGGGREFESLLGRLLVTFSEQAINNYIWDHSSAGRASALQAEGHRFEPYWSHFVIVSYHDSSCMPQWRNWQTHRT